MRRRLKLGLVGAGPVAERYHVPAIRAVPEVKAWMVADLDGSRAQRLAAIVPFEHSTTRVEDLLDQVDVAIVALPNGLHKPVSCQLLDAGIHVLCEKPMARTVSECCEMVHAAERNNALLCIGHNRRFRANVIEAKNLLDSGMIGEITRIDAEEGHTADWPRSRSYFDRTIAGGGALLDVGIHSIDLIRYLVADFVDIQYEGQPPTESVESHCRVHFTLQNGARGTVTSSRTEVLKQQMLFNGTEGSLVVGLWSPTLTLSRRFGKAFRHFQHLRLSPVRRALDSSFVEQLYRFSMAVTEGMPVPVSGLDGLKAVEVVERAYRKSPCSSRPEMQAGVCSQ
jgi:predicted dehydrogenase